MSNDAIVIVNGARTPMGGFQGALKDVSAPDLGAAAIKAAVERAGVSADSVDEVIMGCILTAGLGQGPARQAMRKAGLPDSTGAVTINKLCGSGMKAAMLAHDVIKAGTNDIMVAGGMESMSNAPHAVDGRADGLHVCALEARLAVVVCQRLLKLESVIIIATTNRANIDSHPMLISFVHCQASM